MHYLAGCSVSLPPHSTIPSRFVSQKIPECVYIGIIWRVFGICLLLLSFLAHHAPTHRSHGANIYRYLAGTNSIIVCNITFNASRSSQSVESQVHINITQHKIQQTQQSTDKFKSFSRIFSSNYTTHIEKSRVPIPLAWLWHAHRNTGSAETWKIKQIIPLSCYVWSRKHGWLHLNISALIWCVARPRKKNRYCFFFKKELLP